MSMAHSPRPLHVEIKEALIDPDPASPFWLQSGPSLRGGRVSSESPGYRSGMSPQAIANAAIESRGRRPRPRGRGIGFGTGNHDVIL